MPGGTTLTLSGPSCSQEVLEGPPANEACPARESLPTAAVQSVAPQLPLQPSSGAQLPEAFESSSDEEDASGSLGCPEEVVFLRAKSGIFHLASQSIAASGVQLGKVWLKPCCGMLSTDLEIAHHLPAQARLCRHRACQAGLQQCA